MQFNGTTFLVLLVLVMLLGITKSAIMVDIGRYVDSQLSADGSGVKDIQTETERSEESLIFCQRLEKVQMLQEKLKRGAKQIPTRAKYTNIYEKTGGLNTAIKDIKALNPTQVQSVSYPFGREVMHGFVGDRYVELVTNGRSRKPTITLLKRHRKKAEEKADMIIYTNNWLEKDHIEIFEQRKCEHIRIVYKHMLSTNQCQYAELDSKLKAKMKSV